MTAVSWTLKSKLLGLVLPVGKRLLKDKLPRLTKRQLLLISAFAVLSRLDKPSKDLVTNLSDIFSKTSGNYKDCVSESMVKMAFLLKDYTWHELDEKGITIDKVSVSVTRLQDTAMGVVDLNLLAGYLADHTPAWLRYGSRELLVDDFKRILPFVSESRLQRFQMAM